MVSVVLKFFYQSDRLRTEFTRTSRKGLTLFTLLDHVNRTNMSEKLSPEQET